MKHSAVFHRLLFLSVITAIWGAGFTNMLHAQANQVESNIKMFTHVWDEIIN